MLKLPHLRSTTDDKRGCPKVTAASTELQDVRGDSGAAWSLHLLCSPMSAWGQTLHIHDVRSLSV